MTNAAIILTHNRHELLRECVLAIVPQVEHVVVIDNASDPPVSQTLSGNITLIAIPDQPPNLSRLWNIGIDAVNERDARYVAFLCDDALVPAGWFAAVTTAMAQTGAAAGCSSPYLTTKFGSRLKVSHDRDIAGRMPGWAFVLDAQKGIRADERLHWWWCDTAIDWIARDRGGMVMISGYPVPNRRPDDFLTNVPGLADRAGQDGEIFKQFYNKGVLPW